MTIPNPEDTPNPEDIPEDLSELPQKSSTAEFYSGIKYRHRSPQPPEELKNILPYRFKKDKEPS